MEGIFLGTRKGLFTVKRGSGGWQVALGRSDGDVLLGKPLADWQTARELARLVCEQTELPLDELTQRMFSRVGQYTRSPGEC